MRQMLRPAPAIEVFNRYSRRTETEAVYGEDWLRWTYETPVGRLALAVMVKRAWFSRWYGWRMSRPGSAARVVPFVERYGIDSGEFVRPVSAFASFNEFFIRQLKPSARPVARDVTMLVFPADGRHLGFEDVGAADRFYVKGQSLDLLDLLQDRELARRFAHGTLVISRLCPVDYHRFHFPCDGLAHRPRLIDGHFFSVNPVALARNLGYLARNKRFVTVVDDTPVGTVVMCEVGATCVGTIVHTTSSGPVIKGAEKGFFQFGGSCVVTLFEPRRVVLADDLTRHSADGRELYARMGDQMGMVANDGVQQSRFHA